jgi:hypothetical protein
VAASSSAGHPHLPYSVTACVHCSASTKTTIPVEETAALRDYTSAGLGAWCEKLGHHGDGTAIRTNSGADFLRRASLPSLITALATIISQ